MRGLDGLLSLRQCSLGFGPGLDVFRAGQCFLGLLNGLGRPEQVALPFEAAGRMGEPDGVGSRWAGKSGDVGRDACLDRAQFGLRSLERRLCQGDGTLGLISIGRVSGVCQSALGADQHRGPRQYGPLCLGDCLVPDELVQTGIVGFGRECDGLDLGQPGVELEDLRQRGCQRLVLDWSLFVSALEKKCRCCWRTVEGPDQSTLRGVELTRERIGANLVGLEEGTKGIVILLENRVVLVVVAFGAVNRDAQKRLGGVFDGVLQPNVAIELVPVPDKKAGGSQIVGVAGIGLVGGEHGNDHPVVGHVFVE